MVCAVFILQRMTAKRSYKIQNTSGYGFTPAGEPMPSEQLLDVVRGHNPTILLSFSMGKDSLAMWLYLRDKGFNIIPYFLYFVPGLSYVDKAIAYYEDFFKTKIYQFPHPLGNDMLRTWSFQEPHVISTVMSFGLDANYDFSSVDDLIAQAHGLDPLPFCAIGMRSADNLERRRLIQQQGSLGIKKRRYYYAVWDWDVNRVGQTIIDAKCKLPIDYLYWGRTITAYDYQYLKIIREKLPEDYQRILVYYPLLEAEFFRYEHLTHYKP